MKRGVLIGVGTLGSLGAVLAITPPQFGTNTTASGGLSGSTTPAPAATTAAPTPAATKSTAPAATKSATPKATPKATATKKATATPTPTKSSTSASGSTGTTATATPSPTSTPTPTPSPTKTQSTGVSGTFTGATFPADEYGRNWGNVHVTVTFKNGVISSINGSQNPSSRGYMAFNAIDPYVAGQKITVATIKSKSASSLPYVGGATYSSMAYWQSLKSAISQAGL